MQQLVCFSYCQLKGVYRNMPKAKSFLLGFLLGSFMLTGVAYASDDIEILYFNPVFQLDGEVLPSVSGQSLTDEEASLQEEELASPRMIEIDGHAYWSMDEAADAMDAEWDWQRDEGTVHLTTREDVEYTLLDAASASAQLQQWIEVSLSKELAQMRVLEGDTFILVTRGEKNTGGYELGIRSVEKAGPKLVVNVEYENPGKGDIVTESVTYPYALLKVEGRYTDLKVILNDGSLLPELTDIGYIPELLVEEEGIMVFSTEQNEEGLSIEGATNSFAGAVWVSLQDKEKTVWEGSMAGMAEAPDWAHFSTQIPTASLSAADKLTISVMSMNGEGTQELELPVR